MTNVYIIEDDRVWQILYEKQFSKTDLSLRFFDSFYEYERSEKESHFLISDFFVNGEEVDDWLYLFDDQKGIIVSNAKPTIKIINSSIPMLPKPLEMDKLFELLDKEKSIFAQAEQTTILADFCETEEELKQMCDILLQNLMNAINELQTNAESTKRKYFYHNLINQMRYFKKNEIEVNVLLSLEEQIVNNIPISTTQREDLIKMLYHFSSLIKRNILLCGA